MIRTRTVLVVLVVCTLILAIRPTRAETRGEAEADGEVEDTGAITAHDRRLVRQLVIRIRQFGIPVIHQRKIQIDRTDDAEGIVEGVLGPGAKLLLDRALGHRILDEDRIQDRGEVTDTTRIICEDQH